MDILKAEILKKKRLLEDKNLIEPAKKYFRRGDLVKLEKEEYIEKYGKVQPDLTVDNSAKSSEELDSVESAVDHVTLPRKEVIKRLRERGEPVLLFSETELQAFKRLRKCEILEPEINKGLRNDFQEAMEKVDQAYLNEILKSQNQGSGEGKANDKPQEHHATYEEIQQISAKLGKGDSKYDMDLIIKFLQLILRLWGDELNKRCDAEKTGTRGKMALATYTQTQQYLRPLLSKLKTKTLPEDILDSLTEIVRHLLDRNYIMASDAYLQMAIGNAPWPIGVTMVGIHARTGREKIFSKNVAHVLNDETQRKYIQALKRLMTKCQHFFPTDPSRCVEYSPSPAM